MNYFLSSILISLSFITHAQDFGFKVNEKWVQYNLYHVEYKVPDKELARISPKFDIYKETAKLEDQCMIEMKKDVLEQVNSVLPDELKADYAEVSIRRTNEDHPDFYDVIKFDLVRKAHAWYEKEKVYTITIDHIDHSSSLRSPTHLLVPFEGRDSSDEYYQYLEVILFYPLKTEIIKHIYISEFWGKTYKAKFKFNNAKMFTCLLKKFKEYKIPQKYILPY